MALEEFTGLYYFTVDLPSHLKNQIQATAPDQQKQLRSKIMQEQMLDNLHYTAYCPQGQVLLIKGKSTPFEMFKLFPKKLLLIQNYLFILFDIFIRKKTRPWRLKTKFEIE